MDVLKYLFIVICFVCFTWTRAEDGHCIWYGQCGTDPFSHKPRNCYYSGPAKPFKTAQALELYKDYCPDLYNGTETRTCCGDDQMLTLASNMVVPKQILGQCPSCLRNFLNIYCYLTCAPDHSKFVLPIANSAWVDPKTNEAELQVTKVDYFLTPSFAVGMFNSCRDVQMPSANERAISILCGRSADECTPQNWLDYIGSTSNSQTPFQINFSITDKPTTVGNNTMTPMNASVNRYPCSQRLSNDTAPVPFYRTEQMIITRTGNHSPVVHPKPPPAVGDIIFSPLFDLEFLHQVLDLQLQVEALTAPYGNGTVGLNDICFQPLAPNNTHCTIQSVLNYYQNSHKQLDREVRDPSGFFVMANYLDHFDYCVKAPASVNDITAFHDSCLGTYGGPVYPGTVLSGYEGDDYKNASALVITFVVNNHNEEAKNAQAEAWEKVYIEFMKNYTKHQPNMSIAFSSELQVEEGITPTMWSQTTQPNDCGDQSDDGEGGSRQNGPVRPPSSAAPVFRPCLFPPVNLFILLRGWISFVRD